MIRVAADASSSSSSSAPILAWPQCVASTAHREGEAAAGSTAASRESRNAYLPHGKMKIRNYEVEI